MANEKNDCENVAEAIAPTTEQDTIACKPIPVNREKFNHKAKIPYGLTIEHIYQAMTEFADFLGFTNSQLHTKGIKRFESMLMPANFSSMVGEFMSAGIPKYCPTLVKNQYHNGHPDLIPAGHFPRDSVQHSTFGIEVKASRYTKAWQGHNAEAVWLMVFVFDSNRPADPSKEILPRPFRFQAVYLGELTMEDWKFAGRKEGSRRTITASVTNTGFAKMLANWIYTDKTS
jgi:hypothetical protein